VAYESEGAASRCGVRPQARRAGSPAVRVPTLLGLVDILDRVREASARTGSQGQRIPSRCGDLSAARCRISWEQQDGSVESQDTPPQQPGQDRCFDRDSLRKTERANSSG